MILNGYFQKGREIGLWYAKRQARKTNEKNDEANYLHLNPQNKLLLQTLVKKIETCTTNQKHSPYGSSVERGNHNSRSFLEEYHKNVQANINAGTG